MKKVKITISFDITTNLRDDQEPEEVADSWATMLGLKNCKVIKIEILNKS